MQKMYCKIIIYCKFLNNVVDTGTVWFQRWNMELYFIFYQKFQHSGSRILIEINNPLHLAREVLLKDRVEIPSHVL